MARPGLKSQLRMVSPVDPRDAAAGLGIKKREMLMFVPGTAT